MESSPDNDGTAWHCQTPGPASDTERCTRGTDGVKPRKRCAVSNLVDMGRGAARDRSDSPGAVNSEADRIRRWRGQWESLRRTAGDAAGAKSDASFVKRRAVNVGTILGCPNSVKPSRRWAGPSSAEGHGWGGGPVVVRARESRVHGEGGQQVSSGRTGMSGGRRW